MRGHLLSLDNPGEPLGSKEEEGVANASNEESESVD